MNKQQRKGFEHIFESSTANCVPDCPRCKRIKDASLPTRKQFIVRSAINPSLILCTDGEYRAEGIHTGPGAYAVRVYKTERGALKAAGTDGLRKVEASNA